MDENACDLSGCSGESAKYEDRFYQSGLLTGTVSSGAVTIARGTVLRFFQYGAGESSTAAGFSASGGVDPTFHGWQTNVGKPNGLHGVRIKGVSVAVGRPCLVTASTATVNGATKVVHTRAVEEALETGYQSPLASLFMECANIYLVRCPEQDAEEQVKRYSIGRVISRMDDRSSYRDDNFPHVNGMPGIKLPLPRAFQVPRAKGSERPFRLDIELVEGISVPARTSAIAGTAVHIPLTVCVEAEPLPVG
ncbi:MAG: hypothetical protein U0324_46330 [Polyangiales bacterium]